MNHKSESSLTLPNIITTQCPGTKMAGSVPGEEKEFRSWGCYFKVVKSTEGVAF
jgi:hypothetical protein